MKIRNKQKCVCALIHKNNYDAQSYKQTKTSKVLLGERVNETERFHNDWMKCGRETEQRFYYSFVEGEKCVLERSEL